MNIINFNDYHHAKQKQRSLSLHPKHKKMAAKHIALMVLSLFIFNSCKKDTLTPARDLTGNWFGNLTSSYNNPSNTNTETMEMGLVGVKVSGNLVTGTMVAWPSSGAVGGEFSGHVSGVHLYYTCVLGNGCIDVHGTFTSTNLDGMKGSNPPPYLVCGETLNNGNGSKGLEFHLKKQ